MVRTKNNGMITVREIAEYLRISLPSAYSLVEKGFFPYLKVGIRYVIPRDSFLAWVEDNMIGGASRG